MMAGADLSRISLRHMCLVRVLRLHGDRLCVCMQVRLIRKFAECLNGVDLSHYHVDDVLDLPSREAELLIAEGWALRTVGAADRPIHSRLTAEQLRCLREQLETWSKGQSRRRAEDRIREELRDSRAKTILVSKRTAPPRPART